MSFFSRFHHSNPAPGRLAKPTRSGKPPPFILTVTLELPPIILYGPPTQSTGSLLSGLLRLEVPEPFLDLSSISSYPASGSSSIAVSPQLMPVRSHQVTSSTATSVQINKVTLYLQQTIQYAKPFVAPSTALASCADCRTQTTELARWDVLTQPAQFQQGSQAFPFSHLLPGSLPASSHLGLNSSSFIRYQLVAEGSTGAQTIRCVLPLHILRSILRGPDRTSLRVFPPTDVTATAVLPNVVHPKSHFPLEIKLDNITTKERRWRMRKLSWRIEETVKVRASACKNHIFKLKVVEQHQRSVKSLPTKSAPGNSGYHPVQTSMSVTPAPAPVMGPASNPDETGDRDLEYDEAAERHPAERHPADDEASTPGTPGTPQTTPAADHLYVEEVRTVTHGEVKSGWKSDFSGRGKIELVAEINAIELSTGINQHIAAASSAGDMSEPGTPVLASSGASSASSVASKYGLPNVSCDIDDPTLGVQVSHMLIVEVVIAEELLQSAVGGGLHSTAPSPAPSRPGTPSVGSPAPAPVATVVGIPTGAARVLRMQFKLFLTERSGLGISWDDEVPPTYEAVKALSPPMYSTGTETPMFGSVSMLNTPVMRTLGVLIGSTPGASGIDNVLDVDERIQELNL
ncbi:hypothetical protein BABINDRAFT_162594 [Babjeviella inositovora NRRL Y-12698]|uniref:LDB19 N-terminal domain-containing protein n=1 Tax=Babjeviella inositovora NRRL Y-12698 TaxID=984486 RepID=A0A1E3QPP6_9ASCO|nr:uncharacterized protein BABINDRAFT_162594 [Babjeviella inositovora NRRL Y-12698]ODQ78937.1 hypothetical protein BABINDRAFT_162594 [Babjeviella inositovora NRRL Y-12698]